MINATKKLGVISITGMFLAGCSSMGGTDKQNSKESSNFVKAVNDQKVRTKVVKEYVPVAIPGQLKPIPDLEEQKGLAKKGEESDKGDAVPAKNKLEKKKAVNAANKKARVYPKEGDFFNSMMTYYYMPGAVYTIYSSPMKITDIVLEKGEKIVSQAAGDTLRWQLASTYSGEKDNVQQHILVKPTAAGIENTVVVTTNKRTYHLLFVSTDQDTYMVSVKWKYPKDMVKTYDNSDVPFGESSGSGSKSPSIDLSKMEFDYTWRMYKGETPDWYPQEVFHSDRQTFILLSKKFWSENAELPILELRLANGSKKTMINWRVQEPYMVVDSVIDKAFLKLGVDSKENTTVVAIDRQPED